MQIQFSFFEVFIYLLLLIFLIWAWKIKSTTKYLPSGPWKLPVIGNLHQFVGSTPHHCLRDLARQYGPLMHLQLGQVSTLVISSAEAAKQVFRTHDSTFADRPFSLAGDILTYNSRDIAFSPYGNYWRQTRKICALKLFGSKSVQLFRSIREQEVWNLIKSISSSAGLAVNFSNLSSDVSGCIISRTTFGGKQEEPITPDLVKKVHRAVARSSIGDFFPYNKFVLFIIGRWTKLHKVHKEIDIILENVINQHRMSKGTEHFDSKIEANHLVSALLDLQEDTNEIPLANQDIKAIILDMFTAGIGTTGTVIEWIMSELMRNPMVLEKAQAEVRRVYDGKEKIDETNLHLLKYLHLVIKESLRLHPPSPLLFPRQARERVEMMGYKIPEKTQVIINFWAIGRDPNYWAEPERFFPERFLDSSIEYKGTNFEYIPFGSGKRICPGMLYGMAIVELSLANLLYHFDWKLPIGMKSENLDMTESASGGRKNHLFLVPTPCSP